jgi:Fe2+ transport system protein B
MNDAQYQEYLKCRQKYSLYLKLRKWTCPAHWGYGVLLAAMFIKCWPLTVIFLLIFAMFEWWNDNNLKENLGKIYKKEGAMDWWDSFFVLGIGMGVAYILDALGVIAITWWLF